MYSFRVHFRNVFNHISTRRFSDLYNFDELKNNPKVNLFANIKLKKSNILIESDLILVVVIINLFLYKYFKLDIETGKFLLKDSESIYTMTLKVVEIILIYEYPDYSTYDISFLRFIIWKSISEILNPKRKSLNERNFKFFANFINGYFSSDLIFTKYALILPFLSGEYDCVNFLGDNYESLNSGTITCVDTTERKLKKKEGSPGFYSIIAADLASRFIIHIKTTITDLDLDEFQDFILNIFAKIKIVPFLNMVHTDGGNENAAIPIFRIFKKFKVIRSIGIGLKNQFSETLNKEYWSWIIKLVRLFLPTRILKEDDSFIIKNVILKKLTLPHYEILSKFASLKINLKKMNEFSSGVLVSPAELFEAGKIFPYKTKKIIKIFSKNLESKNPSTHNISKFELISDLKLIQIFRYRTRVNQTAINKDRGFSLSIATSPNEHMQEFGPNIIHDLSTLDSSFISKIKTILNLERVKFKLTSIILQAKSFQALNSSLKNFLKYDVMPLGVQGLDLIHNVKTLISSFDGRSNFIFDVILFKEEKLIHTKIVDHLLVLQWQFELFTVLYQVDLKGEEHFVFIDRIGHAFMKYFSINISQLSFIKLINLMQFFYFFDFETSDEVEFFMFSILRVDWLKLKLFLEARGIDFFSKEQVFSFSVWSVKNSWLGDFRSRMLNQISDSEIILNKIVNFK